MLDRTNIHFKKAVKAVLIKVNRIHNNTISVSINQRFIDITLLDNNSGIFYSDMINHFLSKDEILQKLDNFNKCITHGFNFKRKEVAMSKEYIGTDCYNRKMELYHIGNEVYCDHIKNGVVVKTNSITVDNRILGLFGSPHTSGAYIYDEVARMYGKKL